MIENKPLIILAGPTAVGKTALSIKLAKAVNGEIISADSVQVYKKLNIGSAKITPEEMCGVKHYLIDELEPDVDFNVALFKEMVNNAIGQIYLNGHIPLLTGGTGFYIQAVLRDIDFSEGEGNSEIRNRLQKEYEDNGATFLHAKLKEIDPESAKCIPEGNVKRVIRALEYFELTGEKISLHNKLESEKPDAYNARYFVLNDDRDKLYERIDWRVDKMMQDGLLEEVESLYKSGLSRNAISMQSLGYRQLMDYFYGDCTLEEAVFQIKLQTRHFAKRQLTWFRREKNVIWVNKPEFNYDDDLMLEFMLENSKTVLN